MDIQVKLLLFDSVLSASLEEHAWQVLQIWQKKEGHAAENHERCLWKSVCHMGVITVRGENSNQ